jgi:hypothetical protein
LVKGLFVMKTTVIRSLALCAALLLASAPAFAAETSATDDGFGGSFFTANAPSALGDAAPTTDFAAEEELDADEISKIEPAAGGDSVFTLPDDPAAAPAAPSADGEHLQAPEAPVVPGMTTPQTPAKQ